MPNLDLAIEGAARRHRWVVLAALATASGLAWLYLLAGAGMDPAMPEAAGGMAAMLPARWDLGYAAIMFAMWWIMMLAMMLPAAAPMLLMFTAISRQQRQAGGAWGASASFAAAYLVAWGGFSLLATGLQWGLDRAGLLSPMLSASSAALGGLLLLAAGLYQLTPLKQACLRHCRSPLAFVTMRWRPGSAGAFAMGLRHGAYCLGCCWLLMALLFVGGVMNLYWVAGLAVFVLVEKTVPAGHWLGAVAGLALLAWGTWLLAAAP